MRKRSTKIEQVKRTNRALRLLKKLGSEQEAINCLKEEYGISRPQAYRYVQAALKISKKIPVPEEKEAMIVKLPVSMCNQIRELVKKREESISGFMAELLGDYLKRNAI